MLNHSPILVLDAMGVIYPVGDDVRDLLCPFIWEHGGESDTSTIEALYRETSLGRRSARDFWRAAGFDPELEDEYLRRFELTPSLIDFLHSPPPHVAGIWCLSNDVSGWSLRLRRKFGLDSLFQGFVISGDVGARKPDAAIQRGFGFRANPGAFADDSQSREEIMVALLSRTALAHDRQAFGTVTYVGDGVWDARPSRSPRPHLPASRRSFTAVAATFVSPSSKTTVTSGRVAGTCCPKPW